MLLVGGLAGDAHGEIGHHGGAEIDQRMRGLRQDRERAGERADHALGHRQAAGGGDRGERDPFLLVLHRSPNLSDRPRACPHADNATLAPTQSVLFAHRRPPKLQSTIGIIRKSAVQGAARREDGHDSVAVARRFGCAGACDAGIERAGPGAELSIEEHHHRRVDRRRHRHGRAGAALCRKAVGGARQGGGGREQARRRDHAGGDAGRTSRRRTATRWSC